MKLLSCIIIIIPVFFTVILYQLHKKIKKKPWKATHFSVQVSSLVYIAAVSNLLYVLFGIRSIGNILILFIVGLSVILILQWKKDTDVSFVKALQILLRLSFLVFGLLYILLIFYWALDYFYLGA